MNAYATTSTSLSDLATPTEILTAINQGILEAISNGGRDYLGAIDALIELCISCGACFSSGEIAAFIRTYRPDMKFNVKHDVGNRVRSRFSARMPAYSTGPVVQVSRHTAGYSTTTVGHLVYVYAPNQMAGKAHPFEVTAPKGGGPIPTPNNLPTAPVQSAMKVKSAPSRTPRATRTTRRARTTTRRRNRSTWRSTQASVATVHGNRRLCVSRSSFMALSDRLGTPIQGGSSVYVSRDGDTVSITLTPVQGADTYTLVSTRCRLLFASRSGTAFTPSASYAVTVTDTGLTLDLSTTL